MGLEHDDFEDEWGEFEEEAVEGSRWVLWLGVSVIILFLLGVCLVGGYLLVQQFQSRTDAPPPLVLPTPSAAATQPTAAPLTPESTSFPVAPTATLAQSPTTAPTTAPTIAPPPVGPGDVTAPAFASPPTIDGDLSEWAGVPGYESVYLVYNVGSWDGTDDLTAVWHLGWDANSLYVGVSVTDDTHVQTQTGNQIFRGDSVDMQFDTDRTGDYGDGLSPDDFQITLSPGDFAAIPPSAFRFQGTTAGRILDAPGGHHVTVAAQKTAQGYDLEAAVPWSDLAITPGEGLVIGLALNANDNDTPGTAAQEVMKSHVSTRTLTDPTGWGTMTLR